MAGPKGQERGTRSPLHVRAGVDIAGFRGAHKKRDPSLVPPDAFQEAINARIIDGLACSRGGQSKEITTPIGDEWDSLYDAGGPRSAGLSLYLAADRQVLGGITTWSFVAVVASNDSSHFFSLQVGVTDGYFTAARLYRYDKPIAGEVNLVYTPFDASQNPDYTSVDVIGLTTATETSVDLATGGTEIAEWTPDATASLGDIIWAESGIVYVYFQTDTGIEVWTITVPGGVRTKVLSTTDLYQFESRGRKASSNVFLAAAGVSGQVIVKLSDLSYQSVPAGIHIYPYGLAYRPCLLGSDLYIQGSLGFNVGPAKLLKIQDDGTLSVISHANTDSAFWCQEAQGLTAGPLYTIIRDILGDPTNPTNVWTYDGSLFTDLGTTAVVPAINSFTWRQGPDGRLYSYRDTSSDGIIIYRGGVDDWLTPVTSFGTFTGRPTLGSDKIAFEFVN